MSEGDIVRLLFWILILAGWVTLVTRGVTFLDKKIDKWLDKRYKKEVK